MLSQTNPVYNNLTLIEHLVEETRDERVWHPYTLRDALEQIYHLAQSARLVIEQEWQHPLVIEPAITKEALDEYLKNYNGKGEQWTLDEPTTLNTRQPDRPDE